MILCHVVFVIFCRHMWRRQKQRGCLSWNWSSRSQIAGCVSWWIMSHSPSQIFSWTARHSRVTHECHRFLISTTRSLRKRPDSSRMALRYKTPLNGQSNQADFLTQGTCKITGQTEHWNMHTLSSWQHTYLPMVHIHNKPSYNATPLWSANKKSN